MIFRCRQHEFDLTRRVLLMGILNVTPDSFSEHGENYAPARAVASGVALAAAGADVLDVGGESTRPGAPPVGAAEERARVVPVIRGLREHLTLPISVDTYKADVARAALAAGADIINDISGFRRDPGMAAVAAETGAGAIVMHMRGTPQTMQQQTEYADLFGELDAFFADAIARLTAAGVAREAIVLDPGIGFAKTAAQNLQLINGLDHFAGHGRPLLLGPSRKSFIGKTLGIDDPGQRQWGTAAAVACGIARGARLVRVHDVAEMRQVRDLAAAIAFSPAS